MNSLFGTSGIRGSAKDLLTNQFCFDIGRAFAKFLTDHKQKGKVAVGMDPRESSSRIKEAFSMGLQKENYRVIDQGIAPAPAMNYILIADPSFTGSCMITGSHIRSDYNGLKFFAFKEEILKNHEEEIGKIYESVKEKVKFKPAKIELEKSEKAIDSYKKILLGLAKSPYPNWKVVLDFGNGCQSKIIPDLFKKLNIQTFIINDSLKPGSLIARDTDAVESGGAALDKLQWKVRKEKADFGIAFDVDGDRGVFINEKGEFIPGDYTGTLISKYSDTKVIVTPINVSQVVETIGKPVIRTKVGSPYVVETMKKYGATFGFELNGGGVSAEVMMSRDLGSVTIKILNLLKESKKTLGELVATLPKFYLHRTKVDCPQELNPIILKTAKKKFKGVKIEELDGLKIWLSSSSWILFRPSSNAPEFRVFAEAKTKEKAKKLGQKGINFVKSLIK